VKRLHRVLVLDGHPDAGAERFIHALAASYCSGAESAGHDVRIVRVASLDVPSLRSNAEFNSGEPSETVRRIQADIKWADHLVLLFPLWLGDMPGQLKVLLEQLLRPDFAFSAARGKGFPRKLLAGRSARVIVTMGMPAFFYRWYFRAHSVKNLERNILGFCGFSPVRTSIVGMVEGIGDAGRRKWLAKVEAMGREAR
jgi:putative NADPH-quinone reductase